MDTFNDNMDALNANDIIIAETIPVVNANIITDVEKVETNDLPPQPTQTIKPPEVVNAPAPRNKIDVCDIVKETPKLFRAALSNDKLLQAKNEFDAKAVNQFNDETAEALPYIDDQWSPLNKDGKKVYDKDFLLALRNFPKSKLKPDNILDSIMAMDDKSRVCGVSRYGLSGRNVIAPAFGSSMDQRSPLNKDGKKVYDKDFLMASRNFPKSKLKPYNILDDIMAMDDKSRVGDVNRYVDIAPAFGNSNYSGKSQSQQEEDVKLHETENPWQPTRLNDCTTDEGKKTEELYRKVRGVLNKLTPQKFTALISQIKTLPIDTSEKLQGVIDLVFEKAVKEPNFLVAYALMCRELALIQVPISAESKMASVNFRKLLVTRCQMEFEKNSTEEGRRNEKLKEIEECANPEKKKELNIILDEDDKRIRMKSVGNVRFIGELFKQQMLTVNIMVRCLYHLVENRDEERLECLCELLRTVGKELEIKKVDLGRIFGVMKDIADDKKGKVSNRVRFMLQDVIDLRNGNWVPRRQNLKQKTIDQIPKEAENLYIQGMNNCVCDSRTIYQIKKEAENEQLTIQASNLGLNRKKNADNTNVISWSTIRTKNNINNNNEDEEIYRTVHGVLNKITFLNVKKLRTLSIDTPERLQGVIDLVFEKALDEPNSAVLCAQICTKLEKFVDFRKSLLTRCQIEFEMKFTYNERRNEKLIEIEACADPEKKMELIIILDEEDKSRHMRSVGNVRFIGELYKQDIIPTTIMMKCLFNLVENRDEESIEYLCELLKIIGKELETVDLRRIFVEMKNVIDGRNGKVSGKVKFMLQNIIDDIEQAMTTPRKVDRNSSSNADRFNKRVGFYNRNASNDDGWSTAPSRNKNVTFTVQSDKLKIKQPMADELLGSTQLFGNCVRGSNIKTAQQMPPTNANMFPALEKVSDNMDNRSMNSRPNNKDPYSLKGHSMERTNNGPQQTQIKPLAPPAESKIAPEKLERMIKNIIDEYINDCCSFEDTHNDIKNSLPPMMYEQFVEDAYNSVLDRSRTARIKTGNLLAQLMKKETLQLDSYCNALVKVLSMAEDLIVDIPSLWDYYAELIYAPVSELVVPLNSLHKCTESIISIGYSHKLLASLFKVVIAEKGPNHFLSIWKSSNSSLNDWMAAEQVDSFISSNRFEFLVGSSAAPIGQSNLSFNQIHEKLTQFIQSETAFNDINKWVNANVADRVKDKQFIRVLATVVIENSIVGNKLNVDKLRHCYPFISVYVDNCSDLELQCLYAIQSIINKLNHPQGLLLKIFNTLYEDNTISHDSFICWEQSNDPAEQDKKGVAVKQLTSFFIQLREKDEESASSCSDDD